MTSENYGVREPSDVPNELIIDHDLSLHDLGIDINDRKFEILLHIGSDIIHVSGRDRKDDFEDDQLAPSKPFMSIIE